MTPVAAALIFNSQGKILICQRRPNQEFPLQWEFPGGKIEPGETPQQALERELKEELRVEAEIGKEVFCKHHRYRNGPEVELQFLLVRLPGEEIVNEIFNDVLWVTTDSLRDYDFLEADREIVRRIIAGSIRPGALRWKKCAS